MITDRPPTTRRATALLGAVVAAALLAACGPDSPTSVPVQRATVTVEALEGPVLSVRPVHAFSRPNSMVQAAGSGDVFVAQQDGSVHRIASDDFGDVDARPEMVLDLTDDLATVVVGSEAGLHSIALSPDERHLYVTLTENLDRDHDPSGGASPSALTATGPWRWTLREYEVDGSTVDPSSRRDLISFEKDDWRHNGGQLEFGPDGHLYVSIGDTYAHREWAQDLSRIQGSLLRIDPTADGDTPYTVPGDNPFVDEPGAAPEIWLQGLRNPWRFSFDTETGDLWLADVGNQASEEIDLLPARSANGRGANLGWPEIEGSVPQTDVVPDDYRHPIHTYGHTDADPGCAVIGGFVYRGDAVPELDGKYLFADWCLGEVTAVSTPSDGEVLVETGLVTIDDRLTSFAQDRAGEVYALTNRGIALLAPA